MRIGGLSGQYKDKEDRFGGEVVLELGCRHRLDAVRQVSFLQGLCGKQQTCVGTRSLMM